jgi:hypothetical protein
MQRGHTWRPLVKTFTFRQRLPRCVCIQQAPQIQRLIFKKQPPSGGLSLLQQLQFLKWCMPMG